LQALDCFASLAMTEDLGRDDGPWRILRLRAADKPLQWLNRLPCPAAGTSWLSLEENHVLQRLE
jgi:hypothetical protein